MDRRQNFDNWMSKTVTAIDFYYLIVGCDLCWSIFKNMSLTESFQGVLLALVHDLFVMTYYYGSFSFKGMLMLFFVWHSHFRVLHLLYWLRGLHLKGFCYTNSWICSQCEGNKLIDWGYLNEELLYQLLDYPILLYNRKLRVTINILILVMILIVLLVLAVGSKFR